MCSFQLGVTFITIDYDVPTVDYYWGSAETLPASKSSGYVWSWSIHHTVRYSFKCFDRHLFIVLFLTTVAHKELRQALHIDCYTGANRMVNQME